VTVKKIEKRNILLTNLILREGFNARTDDADPVEVESLAASIDQGGLIHDISTVEDPERPGFYFVVAGATRARALMHLAMVKNYPKELEVTVSVVTSDPTALFVQNLTENVVRRDLHPADLARRCAEMVDGDCVGFDGKKIPAVTANFLGTQLRKSPAFIRELVRAWKGSCVEVRKAWRAGEIVTDQARAWCKLEAKEQKQKLKSWRSEDDKVLGVGEHEPAAKDADADEEESSSKSVKNGNGKHEPAEYKGPTRSELLAKAEAFADKLDKGEFTGDDKKVARAKWEALRWAAGDLRRLGYT
jgi:ParB-like chromosome segregation protein Spo0J